MLVDTTLVTLLVRHSKIRLSGTVKNPEGQPLKRAVTVYGIYNIPENDYYDVRYSATSKYPDNPIHTGISDEDGNFSFILHGYTENDLFTVRATGLRGENHDLSPVCRGVTVYDD